FHDEGSMDMQLSSWLAEIEVLYQKELFDNCISLIKKAKAVAVKYDKLLFALRITEWEMRITDRTNNFGQVEALKNNLISNAKQALEKYNEIIELRNIYIESKAFFYASGTARDLRAIHNFESLMNQPLLSREMKSFPAEISRLTVKSQHAQFRRNNEEIY